MNKKRQEHQEYSYLKGVQGKKSQHMRPECEQLTTHCGQDTFQEGESSIEIFPEKERPKRKSLDQAVGSS